MTTKGVHMPPTTISAPEVESTVYDHLSTLGPERESIRPDAQLEDLDVDSLDVVELSQLLETDYEVEIDPERFVGSKTAGDLARVVVEIVDTSA
jgi:acyl carrier protein